MNNNPKCTTTSIHPHTNEYNRQRRTFSYKIYEPPLHPAILHSPAHHGRVTWTRPRHNPPALKTSSCLRNLCMALFNPTPRTSPTTNTPPATDDLRPRKGGQADGVAPHLLPHGNNTTETTRKHQCKRPTRPRGIITLVESPHYEYRHKKVE